jgi:hypothetical protein
MGKRFTQFLVLGACLLLGAGMALAQVTTTGRLIGMVTDPTGAVVVGADVTVTDEATGLAFETKSGSDGGFTFSALQPGSYTVTVTMQGFKKAEVRAVKIVVGGQRGLTVQLELGEVASTVVIEAGAEVLQTSETKVGTTIMGKSITQLPFTSRDALDLGILMPGAATVGRPRATTFLGLPRGTINITLDGISDMDQYLKSGDGFFTMVRPRIDTIEEFSISTAAGGAAETGEGAVQIRFETKRGANDFHGGAWWYHRNDKFNAQYYFNNEVLAGSAATPKQKQRLNQFGAKVGGPIIKDKLFFFTAIDFYRNPQSQVRTRTILTAEATAGLYRYSVGTTAVTVASPMGAWMNCGAGYGPGFTGTIPANTQCVVNVMTFAGSFTDTATLLPFRTIFDPTVSNWLALMNSSLSVPGVSPVATTSLYTRRLSFTNGGGGRRNFPDFRFDYNLNKNHSITAIYHYNYFGGKPDFLNSYDAIFPVEPFKSNIAGQYSNRNSMVAAWRWNIGTNKSNEFRMGLTSAPTTWGTDYPLDVYPTSTLNFAAGGSGTVQVRPVLNLVDTPLHGPTASGRNGAILQSMDTFSLVKGKHNLSFGGNWTEVIMKTYGDPPIANVSLAMGTAQVDDAFYNLPSSTNIPGSGPVLGDIRSLYAMLTGRVSTYSTSAYLDMATRTFSPLVRNLNNTRQTEIGVFGSDNWRMFSTLTMNLGLRWEYQGAYRDTFNKFYRVEGDMAGLAGYSCSLNNLFTPTATGCASTLFAPNGDRKWYNNDLNNFGPSIGLAWTPSMQGSLYKWIFGGPGKSVFRAGYAINFAREGMYNFTSMSGSNTGPSASTYTRGSLAGGAGTFKPGTVFLADATLPNVAVVPAVFGSTFTATRTSGLAANVIDPNLHLGYVQSWSAGWQREITPSTVVEVRYVANHGTGLWRQFPFNEVNIFQPSMTVGGISITSFLDEFKNAQNNLAICKANQVACRTAAGSTSSSFLSFANLGLAGQVALPVFTSSFTGVLTPAALAAASTQQKNSSFSSGTWVSQGTATARGGFLYNGAAGSGAANLNNDTNWQRLVTLGFPANFWTFNPHTTGDAYLMTNATHTTYNGFQIEVRRKPVKGLQFNGSYSFSKTLSNYFGDSQVNYAGYTSLRNPGYDKGPTPFDLRHQFKMQLIYELPFGPGKKWGSSMGWMNRVIEGWELNTITRWQSGRVFQLTGGGSSGTFNGNDGGVQLIGVTPKDIQEMLSVRKTADGMVFWFPESLLQVLSTSPFSARANPDVIKACDIPGQLCQRLFLSGPSFFRADWSIGKRTKIGEKANIEFRAEFLNAFNNANFFFGGDAATTVASTNLQSTSFGRITSAYQDVSTTDDNGGRIIQMVLRINF